jgi:hypothetical protein
MSSPQDIDIDIFLHIFSQNFGRSRLTLLFIEPEFVDHRHQPCPAQYLLTCRRQSIFYTVCYRGTDELLRDPLRDDKNSRAGSVLIGGYDAIHDGTEHDEKKREDDQPFPLAENLEELLWLHVGSQRHDLPLIELAEPVELAQNDS